MKNPTSEQAELIFLRVQFLYRSLKRGCLKTEFLDNLFVRVLGQISSFEKTRNFPTLSGSNKMKSFEISIVCAQVRLRLRAASSEKLDCG